MSAKKRVLVVDDETSVRESLRLILSRLYDVEAAESGIQALELVRQAETETGAVHDLLLLDVVMPGLGGIDLLEQLKANYPDLPVIMLTATTTVKTAVQAMKIGAVDYLNKPFDVDELLSLIDETLRNGATGKTAPSSVKTAALERPDLPEIAGDFGAMVGSHPAMHDLYRKIEQLSGRDTTILITGESGTGKELIAREIHRRSRRADAPFIAVNCAAIPETLIESELFGHEKGAFTHAVEKRLGLFEHAHNGTLFLDEIGELSLNVQVKMLRFLQEQEFYRVGRSKPTQVDVRVLAATNKNLETAVKEGRFRQDLYYRIHVVTLEMPPLREHTEDIPPLISHFIRRLSPVYGGREVTVTPDAMQILQSYSWPGNVRELENVTESILALCNSSEIGPADLPGRIKSASPKDLKDKVLEGSIQFEDAERQFETELILRALKKTNFVQTRAAEMLGISRRILKYKMDKLGISENDPEAGKGEEEAA